MTMTGAQAVNQTLTEEERFSYLQAMEVSEWILRDKKEVNIPDEELVDLTPDSSVETVRDVNVAESITHHAQHNIKPESGSMSESEPVNYLKMVNWRSNSDTEQTILVVCRHETDQPAHSFARSTAPSQFMTDFVQALQSLLETSRITLDVRLAHLSEAGLGHDCLPMNDVLEQVKPAVILVLGDETVKKMFNPDDDVAVKRGKVQSFGDGNSVITSYHPFTLIKNPHLKPLAMEDLKLLVKLISEGNV